jgi:hypothetical protein
MAKHDIVDHQMMIAVMRFKVRNILKSKCAQML